MSEDSDSKSLGNKICLMTAGGNVSFGNVNGPFAVGNNISMVNSSNTIGSVEGDLIYKLENAVFSGDIIDRDKIINYVNIDPKMMDILAENMIKLLNIDPQDIQAT